MTLPRLARSRTLEDQAVAVLPTQPSAAPMHVDNAPTMGHGRAIRLADGRTLGYDDFGAPGGVPVLFFHGFGSSRVVRHPDDSIAAAVGARVIAVDRPGIGLSTHRPGRRLLDWPADVVAVADALEIERFAILGWSGGGPYALACGWSIPDRVTTISLVSAAAPLGGSGAIGYARRSHRAASRAADHAPWAIRLAMWRWSRAQRADPERHLDEAIESMIEADRVLLEDPALRAMMISNGTEMYRYGARGLYDEALIMARPWGFPLQGVTVPVTLWHGEADPTVPIEMGSYLARTLPRTTTRFYPGEGHHLVYDRWREILAEVVATG